jgi:hypothetical protein
MFIKRTAVSYLIRIGFNVRPARCRDGATLNNASLDDASLDDASLGLCILWMTHP